MDWIDWAVRTGRWLGLDPLRVRWQLEHWRRWWMNRTLSGPGRPAGPGGSAARGGALPARPDPPRQDSGAIRPGAGPVGPSEWASTPQPWTGGLGRLRPTHLLILACLLVYGWLVLRGAVSAWVSLDYWDLVRHGSCYGPHIRDGAWWRLLTSALLHAGLVHLGLNLLALHFLGPLVEEHYGPHRLLLLFWVATLASAGASFYWTARSSVGASGGVMGLCGLLGVWGQRVGTPAGRQVRNAMLTCVVLTGLVGLFPQVDNVAHAGGLVAGLGLGLLLPLPAAVPVGRARWSARLVGALGLGLLCLTTAAIPALPALELRLGLPPVAPNAASQEDLRTLEQNEQRWRSACEPLRRGQLAAALRVYGSTPRRPADRQAVLEELAAACDVVLVGPGAGSGSAAHQD